MGTHYWFRSATLHTWFDATREERAALAEATELARQEIVKQYEAAGLQYWNQRGRSGRTDRLSPARARHSAVHRATFRILAAVCVA